VSLARELRAMVPGNNVSLVMLVGFGHDQEAIELARADWPGLACEGEPEVRRNNVFQAMNLSLAYERVGESRCAGALLAAILELLEGQSGLGAKAFGFLDVELYARLGRIEQALSVLRGSVDAGMRAQWIMQVEDSPHLAGLREEAEFHAMRDVVRADLARQLASVRAMEASGELAPPGD